MRRAIMLLAGIIMGLGQFALVGVGFSGTALAAPSCVDAGSSGFTAVVVATNGQHITGPIDATGCDVGVYVGPDAQNVVIDSVTVSGANWHGILAQDTSGIIVQNSTVTNNAPSGESTDFTETKAIQFSGVSDGTIRNNVVMGNGGGGIAVLDDGLINTGTPNRGSRSPGNNNKVLWNDVENNTNGCGIVVAAYNPGAGVKGNTVANNTVINNPAGIVIAADVPFTTVQYNTVISNTSWGNGLADVVVHSNAPGDFVSNNNVLFNQLGSNNSEGQGIGVIVGAESPGAVLVGTAVVGNYFTNERIGIATKGINGPVQFRNTFDNVVSETGPEPSES